MNLNTKISLLFLFLLLPATGALIWKNTQLQHSAAELRIQIKNAEQQKQDTLYWKQVAICCASTANELNGWKNTPPLASFVVEKAKDIPNELCLDELSIERQFSLELSNSSADDFFPSALHLITLRDHVSFDLYETERGRGSQSIPLLIKQLNSVLPTEINHSRSAHNALGDESRSELLSMKSIWHLTFDSPKTPLWSNILNQP